MKKTLLILGGLIAAAFLYHKYRKPAVVDKPVHKLPPKKGERAPNSVPAGWSFRLYFNDDTNTAYAVNDPVTGEGVTFRVKHGDTVFDAYDYDNGEILERFFGWVRLNGFSGYPQDIPA